LKLKQITLKGFMRFKDSFEIAFPQNQVTLIAGENGAGKTSILDAICICLYGKTFRTSGRATSGYLGIYDLVNHDLTKAIIRLEFENHGHNYVVTREITKHDTDGEIFEDGESKATGRRVYDYVRSRAIGLDWEGFRKSTIVLQGEMSALTDLDPGPRKKAFTQLFGLDRYFVFEQLAKKKADNKASDINATEEANKILQADIEQIPQLKKELRGLRKTVAALERKKEQLGKKLKSRRTDMDAYETGHNDYIKQSEKLKGTEQQISDAKKAVKKNQDELDRLLSIQRQFGTLDKLYKEYSSLEKKISELNPTKVKYDNLSSQIIKLETILNGKEETLSKIVDKVRETKSYISKLRKQIPSASELAKAKGELKKMEERRKEIERKGEQSQRTSPTNCRINKRVEDKKRRSEGQG